MAAASIISPIIEQPLTFWPIRSTVTSASRSSMALTKAAAALACRPFLFFSLIFGDVVVRVSDKYALAMHIDTDESNAAGCGRAQMGEIVK